MAIENLPPPNAFADKTVDVWQLKEEVGRGKIGVVYRSIQNLGPDIDHVAAIKIVPSRNLKDSWKTEIKKTLKLTGVPEVVQFKGQFAAELDGGLYHCIISEYIQG